MLEDVYKLIIKVFVLPITNLSFRKNQRLQLRAMGQNRRGLRSKVVGRMKRRKMKPKIELSVRCMFFLMSYLADALINNV